MKYYTDADFCWYVEYFSFCEETDCYLLWRTPLWLKSTAESFLKEKHSDGILKCSM
ncbi:MAG: hypothetical protein J6Y78_15600 [Paludibacteraceae bacterium]|nr:hypothetical protein [Paludibacteraceae bacterium]